MLLKSHPQNSNVPSAAELASPVLVAFANIPSLTIKSAAPGKQHCQPDPCEELAQGSRFGLLTFGLLYDRHDDLTP